ARVGAVLGQLRHAGEDLMNEAEGRLDVERQQVLLRAGEHARQPDAGNTPRDERDLRAFADVLDVIHAREVLAAHVREAVDPFTDEELERRDRREGVAQDEDLAWPVVGITAVPGAKSVLEDRLPRIVNTRAGCFHTPREHHAACQPGNPREIACLTPKASVSYCRIVGALRIPSIVLAISRCRSSLIALLPFLSRCTSTPRPAS